MKIGDRVHVGDVPYATLPNPAGTIIKDDDDGYWMVALDEPGFSLARDEDVPLVVEHEDNLTPSSRDMDRRAAAAPAIRAGDVMIEGVRA